MKDKNYMHNNDNVTDECILVDKIYIHVIDTK